MTKRIILLFTLFITVLSLITIFGRTYSPFVHAQSSCSINPTSTTTDTTTVTISQTGTYTVWSQILAPSLGNSSYYLKIDGGCAIDVGDSATIPAL